MPNSNVERLSRGLWPQAPRHAATAGLLLAALLAQSSLTAPAAAQSAGLDASPIKQRHADAPRAGATQYPRSEGDQAKVDGWPLYRTERGQAAFNDAMATLKATDGAAPTAAAFKGCASLECNLALPTIGADGWLPAGRLWVSPTEYVLIVHSPRARAGQSPRRRALRTMRYFVFHEFHNSSRNTDLYDTISSHSGSVFVPLYMGKSSTDARGRHFVIVVQVSPYDVVSIHASNRGSAGPGIEVARNAADAVEPLQNLAGIVIAAAIKAAAPHLQVVNHRGDEGQPMLTAYERRLAAVRGRPAAPAVTLPYVPAPSQRLASAAGALDDLILRRGASPRIPMAERGIVAAPTKTAQIAPTPTSRQIAAVHEPSEREPVLVEPIRRATPPACATPRVASVAVAVACVQRLGTLQ